MRAIIIEEARFEEIAARIKSRCTNPDQFLAADAERLGITMEQLMPLVDSIHRTFHYEFVRWAQSHGASCVR